MSEMALSLIAQAKREKWKVLDLGNCGIVGAVPEEVGELEELEELILSEEWHDVGYMNDRIVISLRKNSNRGKKNRIVTLANRMPPNLRRLVANESQLNDLAALSFLPLEQLDLSNSGVSEIFSLSKMVMMRELDLSNTKVGDISPLIGMVHLKELSLSETKVADISPLSELNLIEVLNLSETQVTDLTPLKGNTALEWLDISNTRVLDLSPLSGKTQMRELDISQTQVADCSPLQGMLQLQYLNLEGTHIGDLSPLKGLILDGKSVKIDGAVVSNGIFVKDCPLTNPPQEIAQQGNEAILRYWEELEQDRKQKQELYVNREVKMVLVGNSDAGKTTLAKYLETGKISGNHPSTHGMEVLNWETNFKIKHAIDANTGQELTVRARIFDFGGQEYYHDTHHLFFTTNTAYVLLWDKEGNRMKEVERELVFEKGGQPQLMQFQNAPLPYWLDAIQHFCGRHKMELVPGKEPEEGSDQIDDLGESHLPPEILRSRERTMRSALIRMATGSTSRHFVEEFVKRTVSSPAHVLVVQNKIDKNGLHFLQEEGLKARFPMIFDFAAISMKAPKGQRLAQLKALIQELLDQMPLGAVFPSGTDVVKEAIEREAYGENWEMSLEEFRAWGNALCKEKLGIEDRIGVEWNRVLVNYFAQIGLVLHFPKASDVSLRNQVFLRPDRLTQKIYRVLSGLGERGGTFDREHVWRKLGRSEEEIERLRSGNGSDPATERLLDLMRHFRIIFLEGGKPDRFVAPLYLPGKPIRGVELFLGLFRKVMVRVQYPGFIHKSVVLHFFEEFGPRTYSDVTPDGKPHYYYWRQGIVLKSPNSEAMVLLQFDWGQPKAGQPGENTAAHVDLVQLSEATDMAFVQQVRDGMDRINAGWNAEEMVSADGVTFVPVTALREAHQRKQFSYHDRDSGKVVFLRDFKDILQLELPMKKVFISYSKTDTAHLQMLENHLSVFKRNGLIDTWNCRKLIPGERWDGKIRQELEEADIILFLVSADFLATDYIWDVEIKRAVERSDDKRHPARVVPIIVRACVWEDSPLGVFNSPGKASVIALAGDVDAAWTEVVRGLRRVIEVGVNA